MGPIRLVLPALATAFAAGLTATLGNTPAAAAGDSWPVPSRATITVLGHGYGHGIGLGQYGAEGAARAGLDTRQIIEHYYRGISWGRAGGRVTVLVSADTTDDLVVLPRRKLSVTDIGSGERVQLPDNGARQWRITVARNGDTRVSYRTDRWRGFRNLSGDGEFYAAGGPITLLTPSGERSYRGRLRAASPSPGATAKDTVNDLRLERYLEGVVPLEIPAGWHAEALGAQAVAARTFAAYGRAHPRAAHYQLCDTTSCQVYGGAGAAHPATTAAIRATAKQVLLHEGAPALAQFSASSGGYTTAGSAPYLQAVEDPYDDWAGNGVHSWSVTLGDAAFERAYPAIGDLRRIRVLSRTGHGEWGGRILTVRLIGSRGRVTVSGESLRFALGVRSSWMTFRVS